MNLKDEIWEVSPYLRAIFCRAAPSCKHILAWHAQSNSVFLSAGDDMPTPPDSPPWRTKNEGGVVAPDPTHYGILPHMMEPLHLAVPASFLEEYPGASPCMLSPYTSARGDVLRARN
jgi:hypothetical protein